MAYETLRGNTIFGIPNWTGRRAAVHRTDPTALAIRKNFRLHGNIYHPMSICR